MTPTLGRPQMLRGVGAPRPPGLGAGEQLGRGRPRAVDRGERAQQADVGGGKGVGLAQRAQRDVLRRPFADRRGSARSRAIALSSVAERPEELRIGARPPRPARCSAARARAGHAERREIAPRPARSGVGKDAGQAADARDGLRRSARRRRRPACAARLRAAATVICWPSMARTASSKPSQPPGTRRPGPRARPAAPAAGPAPDARRSSPGRRRDRTPGAPAR